MAPCTPDLLLNQELLAQVERGLRPFLDSKFQRGLKRIDKHGRHVKTGLLEDLLKTGRAGDVDLGHAVADHVHPGQQQVTALQNGAQRLADLLTSDCCLI